MLGVVTSRMAAAAFLVGSSSGGSSDMPITSRSLAAAHASPRVDIVTSAPAAPNRWRRENEFTEYLCCSWLEVYQRPNTSRQPRAAPSVAAL